MSSALTICACYCVLSVGTYFVWFSRWNILAHLNAAFCVVAYIIPILVLGVQSRFSPVLVDEFARIMTVGTVAYVGGLFLGAIVAGREPTRAFAFRVSRLDEFGTSLAARRLTIAIVIGIVLTLVAAVGMGGLPLFTDDPLSAKYFKGDIKEKYDQVAILYRLGTGILTVLPPIAVALAVQDRKRRAHWVWLSAISLFLMLATLQRGPMAEGLLLVVCVLLLWKRKYLLTAVLICSTYVVGTLMYTILGALGLTSVGNGAAPGDFLTQIASTAPDVTDTLSFVYAWFAQGEPLTMGRTMWGGLVPGQFEWNPAVWSLVTQNFGGDINQIRSGGLRLPVPVWGIANFGDFGLIFVPFIAGVIAGFAVRRMSTRIPSESRVGTTVLIVSMNTIFLTIGSFYMIGYLEVVKAAALLWVLWPCLKITREQQRYLRQLPLPAPRVREPRNRAQSRPAVRGIRVQDRDG